MSGRSVAVLDVECADKLAKLLGMLGSSHDGEVAAAGRMADKLIRTLGLTWFDIITPRSSPSPERTPRWMEPVTVEEALQCAVDYVHILTPWETKFVRDLHRKRTWRLSDKQNDALSNIVEKIRCYCEPA